MPITLTVFSQNIWRDIRELNAEEFADFQRYTAYLTEFAQAMDEEEHRDDRGDHARHVEDGFRCPQIVRRFRVQLSRAAPRRNSAAATAPTRMRQKKRGLAPSLAVSVGRSLKR